LDGLWALELSCHPAERNLRCARSLEIRTPNPNSLALIVSEISAFIRAEGQTASDPDQEYIYDPDQEYIYFMGSETLPYPDQEYIYFMGSETLPSIRTWLDRLG